MSEQVPNVPELEFRVGAITFTGWTSLTDGEHVVCAGVLGHEDRG